MDGTRTINGIGNHMNDTVIIVAARLMGGSTKKDIKNKC